MMTNQDFTRNEHRRLLNLISSGIDLCFNLGSKLELKGESEEYFDQYCFNYFLRQVDSIDTCMGLICEGKYAECFRIIRSVFEHYLLFLLITKGYVFEEIYELRPPQGVTKKDLFKKIEPRLQENKDILDFEFKGKSLFVRRRGIKSSNGENKRIIPMYYFVLNEYDPILHWVQRIPEIQQAELFPQRDQDLIKYHAHLYSVYLNIKAVIKGLKINKIVDDSVETRIIVHYNFLSLFVHPSSRSNEILEGKRPRHPFQKQIIYMRRYDHYISECLLLYSLFLLKYFLDEILSFLSYNYYIKDHQLFDSFKRQTKQFDYFWFLDEHPHEYDYHCFETLRVYKMRQGKKAPNKIPYYKNPLERLIKLHRSQTELTTGQTYQSPFPRDDAEYATY
ncbi:hypothetical protein J7M02_00795 [Candidatus Aerophobetes bacterium]|nr:hypothetical protein [Candidatus Aerophobetes bacterium]